MEIANREDYTLALATAESALSVNALNERVKTVNGQLQKNTLMPGNKVIVFIADKTLLLPTLWALLKSGITCIPVDPAKESPDIAAIASQWEAVCVITEEKYAGFVSSIHAIVIDKDHHAPTTGISEQIAVEPSLRFIFCNEQNNYQSAGFVNNASMADYFAELDAALVPSPRDIIMLSEQLSFPQQVMELIWASSRGISIAMPGLMSNNSLSRFTHSANRFSMEFGLFHFGSYIESAERNKYAQLYDTVQFADRNGFKAVWTPERHFNEFGGLFPNPSVLSAAIAAATSRVQIRCGSIVAPLHHPVRIAEDWSLIDNLSDGRVAISFASGWQCDDFIFFPENYPQRHDCMMNCIETVRRLWKGEKLPFKNGLGKDVAIAIFPKPVQKELPVWITVSARTETFIDAGKIGANILTHLLWQDSDELIDKIAAYRRSLEENGFDPRSRTVSVMVHTYLGKDDEVVKNKVREPLKNYIRTSTQLIQAMVKSNVEATNAKDVAGRYGGLNDEVPAHLMDELVEIAFNRFFEQAALLGSLEKAGRLLKKLKAYDVDEIAALIDFGLSREDIMEGLVYLNKLRAMYDKEAMASYPVTITHCTGSELEYLRKTESSSVFLNAQRIMLVDTDDEKTIPEYLSAKTRIVQCTCEAGQELAINITAPVETSSDKKSVFMAAVSSDFE